MRIWSDNPSNYQFREIDTAMRIMVKMVIMIVMVIMVAMVIMVTKVTIHVWGIENLCRYRPLYTIMTLFSCPNSSIPTYGTD